MNIKIEGKNSISAKIIADSISSSGTRIITYELVYPRWIHAEVMTHRVFSRNSASSRAIPISAMIASVTEDPAMPVFWGKNQPGMQAKEELDAETIEKCKEIWLEHIKTSCDVVNKLSALGLHKQISNRLLEWAYNHKIVLTSTEYDNWDALRFHEDAQPEIYELARVMKLARECSQPKLLMPGEWHLPYVEFVDGKYYSENSEVSLDDGIHISASCCAQVSYRKNDTSLEKANMIFERLVNSEPLHASPLEHQATPMDLPEGVQAWSGNFRNWTQYRKVFEQCS